MEHYRNDLMESMKILYVEDETEAREEFGKFLKRRAGKIYTAGNGEEGLALYKEYKPDIVIADLYMPVMDGLDMVREIRKFNDPCYVIILSGVNDVNVILKSVDVGIDKYIIKPIDFAELLSALSEALTKITKERDLQFPFKLEQKKKLEDEIKKQFSAFLKSNTGKGPRDVSAFITENTIEIVAYDALTIMEKSMIDNYKNNVIIEQHRKLFYSIKEGAICDMISSIIQRNVQLELVEINIKNSINKLKLSIL